MGEAEKDGQVKRSLFKSPKGKVIFPPEMPREVTHHMAEHEVFLSFLNDIDAELFHEWWEETGCAEFQGWASRHVDERR